MELNVDEFMNLQKRLLMEQIDLLSRCELGQKIMGKNFKTEELKKCRGTQFDPVLTDIFAELYEKGKIQVI